VAAVHDNWQVVGANRTEGMGGGQRTTKDYHRSFLGLKVDQVVTQPGNDATKEHKSPRSTTFAEV